MKQVEELSERSVIERVPWRIGWPSAILVALFVLGLVLTASSTALSVLRIRKQISDTIQPADALAFEIHSNLARERDALMASRLTLPNYDPADFERSRAGIREKLNRLEQLSPVINPRVERLHRELRQQLDDLERTVEQWTPLPPAARVEGLNGDLMEIQSAFDRIETLV